MPDTDDDAAAIEDLARRFFGAFTSGADPGPRLDALRALFLPGAVIVRACGEEPASMDVDAFIEPRRRMLTDGTLVDFTEQEVRATTTVFGDIAHRVCVYEKRGIHRGTPTAGRGMKFMHAVRTRGGWRISAVAWEDERPGLAVPAEHD